MATYPLQGGGVQEVARVVDADSRVQKEFSYTIDFDTREETRFTATIRGDSVKVSMNLTIIPQLDMPNSYVIRFDAQEWRKNWSLPPEAFSMSETQIEANKRRDIEAFERIADEKKMSPERRARGIAAIEQSIEDLKEMTKEQGFMKAAECSSRTSVLRAGITYILYSLGPRVTSSSGSESITSLTIREVVIEGHVR